MTCSGDKIAAEEKSRKKEVPCFGFNKVSYNARYTNIRGVKKPSFSGFGPFGVSGIHLGLLDTLFTCMVSIAHFACVSLHVFLFAHMLM